MRTTVPMRTTSLALLPFVAALLLVVSGCGGAAAKEAAPAPKAAVAPKCPAAWVAGWKRLARQVDAPVYCPTWLPQPLDGKMGGEYVKGPYLKSDHSYLVAMLWFEMMPNNPHEVHVNLRGYPGHPRIPICQDTLISGNKVTRPNIPCFADARQHLRVGDKNVTVYTANQGADTWHVLYAWHYDGSLYTISQHIAPPFTYRQVVQSLNRMLRGLVLVQP
jgi:hypothetical protein